MATAIKIAAMTVAIVVVKMTVKMMKIVMMVVVIAIVPTQTTTAESLKSILENIQPAFQIYPQTTAF